MLVQQSKPQKIRMQLQPVALELVELGLMMPLAEPALVPALVQ